MRYPVGSEPTNDNVSDPGQDFGRVTGWNAGAVFAECFIPDPMKSILDSTLSPPPTEQLGRFRLGAVHAGDGVLDFGRRFSPTGDGSSHATNLPDTWPVGSDN